MGFNFAIFANVKMMWYGPNLWYYNCHICKSPIRILLSIATFYDYEIWQMDVNTAFLDGNLEESIYMGQPKGFIKQRQEQKICRLQKSIYALKQAS